ncbi:MAG: NAD(P)/FAD-dependent oxidoreductase [Candidatus Sumerlaeia bacterium]|nr:NAD(P)/FAD-dependent oxidoreductase [Candidatus Sumerlaeia bacterium]
MSKNNRFDYDLVVLGGGSGGLTAAVGATKLGLRVVLINGGQLGGDCLNHGCVPSKALLKAAKVARTVKHSCRYGIESSQVSFDYDAIKNRIDSVQNRIREHEHADWFRAMGMDVIEDYASFDDPHTIKTGGRTVTARLVVIATGSRAAIPPITGLRESGFVTNEGIFSMPRLPGRLAIIGGGPIGTEMAFAHCQLGVDVTLIETGSGILGKDDQELSQVVSRCLEEDGVKILTKSKVSGVVRMEDGTRQLHIERERGELLVDVDEILLATGRQPNVDSLSLENAGVKYTARGIEVDQSQRTSRRHIYAVGDVTGGLMFTHAAGLEAGTFIKSAIFHLPAKTNYKVFPWCTYTEPELASVGITEAQAKAQGIEHIVTRAAFAENDRAMAEGSDVGQVKVIIEAPKLFGLRGGKILGAQIVGPHAGELIHEFVVAINTGVTATQLSGMTHAYPSLAEINKRAISTHLGGKLFTTRTRKWLKRLFGFAGLEPPTRELEADHG